MKKIWAFSIPNYERTVHQPGVHGLKYIERPKGKSNGIDETVKVITAAWLAQLVERQSAVREVEGSSPRPDQHSGFKNN